MEKIIAFENWCWRRLFRIPGQQKEQTSIWEQIGRKSTLESKYMR